MCLISNTGKPNIAEKDITVYKVLLFERGKYVGPWYSSYEYKDGENVPVGDESIKIMWHSLYEYKDGENKIMTCPRTLFEIFGGFLHAYPNEFHARDGMWDTFNCWHTTVPFNVANIMMVKMTIPKGTRYFISRDGTTICAKKLVWNKNEEPVVHMDPGAPFLMYHPNQTAEFKFMGNPDMDPNWKKHPDWVDLIEKEQ